MKTSFSLDFDRDYLQMELTSEAACSCAKARALLVQNRPLLLRFKIAAGTVTRTAVV
jgi:hypothetical protein